VSKRERGIMKKVRDGSEGDLRRRAERRLAREPVESGELSAEAACEMIYELQAATGQPCPGGIHRAHARPSAHQKETASDETMRKRSGADRPQSGKIACQRFNGLRNVVHRLVHSLAE